MASIIPIPQKSTHIEVKAKSHPCNDTYSLPSYLQRSRHPSNIVRAPTSINESSKVFLRIKRCLHCQYPIYCPNPKNDPNFCSKDCATCYNWFRTTDQSPFDPAFAHVPCPTNIRNQGAMNQELEFAEDIQSFSYRPTWLKSDNV